MIEQVNRKYFNYEHLPSHLKEVSRQIALLMYEMDTTIHDGIEKEVGMRKLLEAKDCFVRAALENRND